MELSGTVLNVKVLVCLLAAHVLVDFMLQTDEDVAHKGKLAVLLRHAGTATLLSYVLCGLWTRWEIPLTILVTHCVADLVKVRVKGKGAVPFIVDQAFHLAVLLVLSALVPRLLDLPSADFWGGLFGGTYYRVLVVFAGAVATVQAGAILVGLAVEPFLDQLRVAREEGETGPVKPFEVLARGFEDGGRVIGKLERALIFLLVLVGQAAGVAFLVAAKSVFRFGELSDKSNRMEAEYILIGTLLSFLYALVIAYGTRYLLGLV